MKSFIVLLFLAVPAYGQYLDIKNASCDCPLSRGSQAVITGDWYEVPELAPVAASVLNPLPKELAGYSIDVNGVKQGISLITRRQIFFAVSADIPVIPNRPKPKPYLLTLYTPHGKATWYFYMADSVPWLVESGAYVTGKYSLSGDPALRTIAGGVVELPSASTASVYLEATGALSFYGFNEYYAYLLPLTGEAVELPAQVLPDPAQEGRQIVSFAIPGHLNSLGEVEMIFRTPSAFSQAIKIKIVAR